MRPTVVAFGLPMDPLLDISRAPRRPLPIDYAATAFMVVWAVIEGALANAAGPVAGVSFGLGFTLPLVFRRRYALEVLAWVCLLAIARAALDAETTGAMPFPVMLIMTFSVGLHVASDRVAVGGLIATIVSLAVIAALGDIGGGEDPVAYVIVPGFVGSAYAAGRVIRRRALQVEAEQARGGERAREAVLEERARIARELHDVVAHSVSIVTVQAGAAEQVLESSPELAREHLAAVRRTAREALMEMRRLTDVLREHDGTLEPQPGLQSIPDLVRGTGLPVAVKVDGDRDSLAAGVDLAAFRIVQEALTNVTRHAGPVATEVAVFYGPESVRIRVENEAGATTPLADDGSGRGLHGMRERVRVYGGSVTAGPRPDGGFVVEAVLPREGRAS